MVIKLKFIKKEAPPQINALKIFFNKVSIRNMNL